MAEEHVYPPASIYVDGLLGRCPRCSKGHMIKGLLAVTPKCEVCGLDFSFADAGDGPAIFVMTIVGFIVIGVMWYVEVTYQPSYWIHAAILLPLIGDPLHRPAETDERVVDRASIFQQGGRKSP